MTSYNLSVPWDSPSVQFRIGNKICLLTKRRKKATILKWWNIILIRLDTWSAYLKQCLVSVPPVERARCVSVTNILSTININNLLSYPRYSLHTCEWQELNNETADRAAPSNLRISICVGRSLVNRNKPHYPTSGLMDDLTGAAAASQSCQQKQDHQQLLTLLNIWNIDVRRFYTIKPAPDETWTWSARRLLLLSLAPSKLTLSSAPARNRNTILGFKLNPLWTNAFHPASKQTGQVRKGR